MEQSLENENQRLKSKLKLILICTIQERKLWCPKSLYGVELKWAEVYFWFHNLSFSKSLCDSPPYSATRNLTEVHKSSRTHAEPRGLF